MTRHRIVALAAALCATGAALARVSGRPARIAWPASTLITQWPPDPAFVEAMRERGWIEGTHDVVDAACYEGRAERIPPIVAELLERQPGLIIGSGTPPMRALMQATKTIPNVMFTVGDPLGQGFVASLARPGGNVAALSSLDHGILAKQFELLLQAAPHVRRVGALHNPGIGAARPWAARRRDRGAAPRGTGARAGDAHAGRDRCHVRRVAARTGRGRALPDAALPEHRRWPTALGNATQVRTGGLVAYGWTHEDMLRRPPHFVVRILEGTPPGEMPVEQPTRFHTVFNPRTAKALGLTLPQSLLLQADEVIE